MAHSMAGGILALRDASTFTGQLASRFDFGTTWGPGAHQPPPQP